MISVNRGKATVKGQIGTIFSELEELLKALRNGFGEELPPEVIDTLIIKAVKRSRMSHEELEEATKRDFEKTEKIEELIKELLDE